MQFNPVSGHEFVLVSEQAFVVQIAENVSVDMQACQPMIHAQELMRNVNCLAREVFARLGVSSQSR
jgi:hypothetical protein